MKPIKLTKPQEALLRELGNWPLYVADCYKPGNALVSLGLAHPRGYGYLEITDAGREWIKERDAE